MLKKLLILVSFCFAWQMATAQPVTFNYQSALLNPISGFAGYANCAVDMNGDQLDDVVRIGNKGFYIDYQQPDGSFAQHLFSMPILSVPNWSICAGDLDNNGYNDLLFAGGSAVSFVKANSNGSAYLETVMPGYILSQRSTFADIDNNGWLDAFVCNDVAQSVPFRNDGAGNLTVDTNLIHTANRPGSYSAIWTDYDNDSDPDLYITKCWAAAPPGNVNRTNLLYRNNGDGTFSEVGTQAGIDDNAQSWSTVFEDFDNDGDFDAFIVNHDQGNRLFRNNGDGTFTDVIAGSGINASDLGAWENAAGDFNNDGFVDIFSELKRELYLSNGDLTFVGQDAPVTPGAIADLNNDGFLDVLKNSQVWLNDGNGNHWLKVLPLGISSNRNGIGARVEIYGAWGIQVREVRSGQSFSPMNSLTVHFGLGQNTQIDSLKIRWLSGIVTTLQNPKADSTYILPEAVCLLQPGLLTISGGTSICPGDTTQLFAPAGYSNYLWSNNQASPTLSVTSEGRFFVILTDSNGCVALTQPVEIQFLDEVVPTIFSPSGNVLCQGDTLVLSASSGVNYQWSDGTMGTQTLAVAESGLYTVATDALCSLGQLVSAPFEVVVLPSPSPVVMDVAILPGDSILLTASGENCQWYDQPFGGNLLAIGSVLQTMPLSSSSTYFVESHQVYPSEIQPGGKLDTDGTGGLPTQGGYLFFETWAASTLKSVSVFVPLGAPVGPRFVQLFSANTLLAVKQFEVLPGWNVLDLNFDVPVGAFSLRCPQGGLWRNVGLLDYPYPIGAVGQITASNFGKNYYYYFYDWKIETRDFECVSERAAVHVSVSATKEPMDKLILRVYPNPTEGLFRVELSGSITGTALCRLLDASGREVYKQVLGEARSSQIDLSKLPAGLYRLQAYGDRFFETCKLLKI